MGKIVKFTLKIEKHSQSVAEGITPAIYYAVGAFKHSVNELLEKGIIKRFIMKDFGGMVHQNRYLRLEDISTISELPEHTRAEIILNMCENIHNGWVFEHDGEFFTCFAGWEFVYLPLELIGVQQLSYIFDPLEKALPRFGLADTSWEMVLKVYNERRGEIFKNARRLPDLIELVISSAEKYVVLKPELREALKKREMAFNVARQIVCHSAEMLQAV